MGRLTENSERDEVKQVLCACIAKLYEHDLLLLENDVSERAITHKLAEYLQLETALNVDCEYNRNLQRGSFEPKSITVLRARTHNERQNIIDSNEGDDAEIEEKLLSISTYPDIIVHKRGTNDQNLLVIEVKKNVNRAGHDHDYEKLKAFTENSEQNSYHYKYGVFLEIETRVESIQKPTLTWFAEGTIN